MELGNWVIEIGRLTGGGDQVRLSLDPAIIPKTQAASLVLGWIRILIQPGYGYSWNCPFRA